MKARVRVLMLAALLAIGAQAESITHGGTTINMDFVDIGHTGNVGDTQDYDRDGGVLTFGAVDYDYRMGKALPRIRSQSPSPII